VSELPVWKKIAGSATKEISVVVGTHAMALKNENGLRDFCSAKGITFDNQYEGRDIKTYINPNTLLEYTIHLWRAGEGLRRWRCFLRIQETGTLSIVNNYKHFCVWY
jgi:hypothetical protein